MEKILIVTSHYTEDLDWLVNQNEYDYKIYTKNIHGCVGYPKEKVYECPNYGNESSSYLCYILENYDNLPDYVAFIHGHETDYHQTDTILNLLKNVKFTGYESLNREDYQNVFNDEVTEDSPKRNWEFVKMMYDELRIDLPKPKKLELTACAQFVVSKELIRSNDIRLYRNLLNWLMRRSDIPAFWSGRLIEHLWCYILTHKEVEREFQESVQTT